MVLLVKIIGIIIMAMGLLLLVSPQKIRQLIEFIKQGKRIYFVGMLRFLFGIILLLSATQCRVVVIVAIMGILFLISALTIFALGLEKLSSLIDWWSKRPVMVLRLLAVLVLALGGLLIYSA